MKKSLLLSGVIVVLISCSEKLYIADAAFEQKHLPFLLDQKTEREEIIMRLGEPSWSFENGRILTYRISLDKKGNVNPVRLTNNKNDSTFSHMAPISIKFYSLVLIFSARNILEKHSLLLTNP